MTDKPMSRRDMIDALKKYESLAADRVDKILHNLVAALIKELDKQDG